MQQTANSIRSLDVEAPQAVDGSHKYWRGFFQDVVHQHGYRPLRIEGQLPEELNGSYYQNGPANFSSNGKTLAHIFTGDGLIRSVRLQGGKAEGAVKVVDSVGRQRERTVGKPLYDEHGGLMWQKGYRLERVKGLLTGEMPFLNAGNTNILPWQDQLLALYEAALPTALNPDTLDTLGTTTLDDSLIGPFSAHPHWVSERQCGYNFGVRAAGRDTWLDLYSLPAKGACQLMSSVKLDRRCVGYIHDFMATPNYLVFFVPPMHAGMGDLFRVALGASPFDMSKWDAQLGTEVIVVPIDQPDQVIRFSTDPFFAIHHANGYEENGKLVLNYIRSDDHSLYQQLGDLHRGLPVSYLKQTYPGLWDGSTSFNRLTRSEIDLQKKRMDHQVLNDLYCEFPRINPGLQGSRNRYTYMLGMPPGQPDMPLFTTVEKYDAESGHTETLPLGDEQYPNEPVFIRKQNAVSEDAGYLLSVVYDGNKDSSYLAVVDAERFNEGVVAKVHFEQALPISFHGNWLGA
jgi:all-trans-8'-apo-beta-carotenal 15,15'-oxygenase